MTFKVTKKHKKLRMKGTVKYQATCKNSGGAVSPGGERTVDFSAPVGKHGKVKFAEGSGGAYGSTDMSIEGALHGKSGTLKFSHEEVTESTTCGIKDAKFAVKKQ
jgi:hypothetical protein